MINMNATRTKFNNESKLENLAVLKRTIGNGSFNCLNTPNVEWGGANVIITSCKDRVKNSTHDNDIFVLTKHSIELSKLFYYVKENIMDKRDFRLYGFMALLANDFIEEFGDLNDYTLLLNHIISGIAFYYLFPGEDMFNVMRFLLSYNIHDGDIKHIL